MSDYLIDFNTAIEAMKRISDCICEAEAVDALCELPTIELIRCKDCKLNGVCVLSHTELAGEGYCAWAEPRVTE